MAITTATGNLLLSTCDALVNTVNCRGPAGPQQASMGAGLAKAFAAAYPEITRPYKAACLSGTLHVGVVQILRVRGKFIVNLPTKDSFALKSQLPWIRYALSDLAAKIPSEGITSIAVPPLGCGLGGLDWRDVEPLVREHLGAIPNLDVVIYPPATIQRNEPWKDSAAR
jgi:O-acetyl-ADP-ribose deacetylase (regulator of RNase III)